MTTVRKESEPVGGNELVVEIVEDSPQVSRVTLTLMSKGEQGEIALGRANLGQVFRKQTRPQAESLVDAIMGFLRKDEVESVPVEKQIAARVTGKPLPAGMPTPVKERKGQVGVELDHFTRRDFAATLRQLADQVETNDPKVIITALDIQPIRGGGQTIVFNARRGS